MNVPEIRFRGFTDAWAQRKLGEVAEFSKGSGYSKSDLSDVGMPIILYGRLYTRYETVIEDIDTFVDPKENSVISCGGEIIVPSSGETAEDISRASVVGKKGIVLGGDLNIVRADSTINPTFLAFTISNGNQQKELTRRAQGKSVVHLNNSDLKEVMLQLPSFPEQTAIGNFFRTLDDTITLHKRKLDGLKELKKGYLQLMFPQAGERVPRVRFAGFTGEWEERKLGEVAEHFEYGLNASAKEFDGVHKYIRITDIDEDLRRFNESNLTSPDIDFPSADNYLLRRGDILFARTGASVGKTYIHREDESAVYFAGFLIRARFIREHSPEFIYQNTLTEKYNTFINIMSQRSGQPGVNAQEYAGYSLGLPSESEQTSIGNFFRSLDEQIATQSKKLRQLKQLKAAYLQKMFV